MSILYSNIGDLRLASMITAEINLLLRDISNLRNTPYLSYQGSINGIGSDTIKVRQAGYGYDLFETPVAEDTALSDHAFTDSSVDIAVARLGLMYQISDLASMTGMGAMDVDPFTLARSLAESYEATFADKTADVMDNFTTGITSSSVFTLDDFLTGIYNLEKATNPATLATGVPGPFVSVLHPKQLTELQDDLRNEQSNVVAFNPANAAMLEAKGEAYAGSLFGVDIYKSAYVNSAASKYQGAMWGRGAIGYADGVPSSIPGAAELMNMGKIVVELDRVSDKAISRVIGHAYLGMSVISDKRGIVFKSDV
jgi:hypothetical protein